MDSLMASGVFRILLWSHLWISEFCEFSYVFASGFTKIFLHGSLKTTRAEVYFDSFWQKMTQKSQIFSARAFGARLAPCFPWLGYARRKRRFCMRALRAVSCLRIESSHHVRQDCIRFWFIQRLHGHTYWALSSRVSNKKIDWFSSS